MTPTKAAPRGGCLLGGRYGEDQASERDRVDHLGRGPGYAGPPIATAAEGLSKYNIITDMYAKAVQGMAPEESVKWAEGELKRICLA